ncbi:hypothetical protein [Shewanella salipaludis]|uniref:Uncharacterized protein n=1 Tax=Shewanella salipaludis TaxID=2723052 RepID=A0A972JJG8_9GAMM|nr:hypothetical protein [Shewanella salipaludis]NMH66098.1 hypothetical protein [Shewanella salipaludis]
MKRLSPGLIFGALFTVQAMATELHPYQDPIPLNGYVSDIDALLSRSLQRNQWTFSKDEAGHYFASITHKSYEITSQIVADKDTLQVKLLSATRVECSDKHCSVDEDKVEGWLTKLRRSIAYDLTLVVRDAALKKSLQ